MSKRPPRGQRREWQPGDKPNPKFCSHRGVVQWPGTAYGSCTACGTPMRRRYQDGQGYWEPIPERREKRRPAPALDPAPSLFSADQLPPMQWQTQGRKEGAE